MWVLITLTVLNAVLSYVANEILNFSALNIAPAGVILIARNGGSVWFSTLVLTLTYAVVSVDDVAYLWKTIPLVLLTGYLTPVVPSIAALLVIYHILGAFLAFITAHFDSRYVGFMTGNYAANLFIGRLASLLG